ncbi:MAG TPA: PVC-type heme-binding CxxCH protein [Gemmataceae bacterium]|jgi:quinoprotein glucose dehydrogenase
MRRPAILLAALATLPVIAADPPAYQADVKPASPEAQQRLAKFRVPAGLKAELWAAEPLLANPVAFAFDEHGRCFVAETYRLGDGVPDIRGHMDWLDDDLACRTVADRLALYRKHLGPKFDSYTTHHDRITLVEDTTGSGKADKSTVFADGFNTPVSGLGAGVLARRGTVWYTCIPDLWKLEEKNASRHADVRTSLSTGYGVHNGFIGHDLHGLRFGPDGKLYFSIGDRGLNVTTPDGRRLVNPDSGAVLRCNPDGTELEIVATGLRNPQELAFDEFGNLFTCDNNSDSGDKARWVHVVEGGDSGWRTGYQYLEGEYSRGPFNAEKLWYPAFAGQAAYIVPPLFNIADGPSGLCHDPGTGLPEQYRGRFFLCDFRGASGISGVRSVKLRPKGASFELAEESQFFWGILATDCDFAPDGGLYVSDWHEGWGKPGKGRLYRLVDPAFQGSATQTEVKRLLAEGMDKRPVAELVKLLGHADQRVRQEAQFALAAKGKTAIAPLTSTTKAHDNRLARIHAIWGLGQIAREGERSALKGLPPLLADSDAQVRAQSAKVLGDNHYVAAWRDIAALLRDGDPQVCFCACMALGKLLEHPINLDVLEFDVERGIEDGVRRGCFTLLRTAEDKDPYLRHAAAFAVAKSASHSREGQELLAKSVANEPPPVRLGVVVALRRLGSPEVARFLDDPEPRIVLEAARAIYDVPISDAMHKLAALITRSNLPEPLGRRVLAANLDLGRSYHAVELARFAAQADQSDVLRVEALRLLGQWPHPPGRDPVLGLWRPPFLRPTQAAADSLKSPQVLAAVFAGPDRVRRQAAITTAQLHVAAAAPHLLALLADTHRSATARVEALKALASLQAPGWAEAVEKAVTDPAEPVRAAACGLLARLDPAAALRLLGGVLEHGGVPERQAALATLGGMRGRDADAVLARMLDQLLAGKVPAEVRLDLLAAAEKRSAAAVKAKLAAFEARRSKTDHLAEYREVLVGGHADNGKTVFFEKQEVACLRCHKVGNDGGDVGPNLSDVGKRQSREYILESIVDPNRQIAQGFETVVLWLKDGRQVTGVLRAEDAAAVTLMLPDGSSKVVAKGHVESRERGPSAMPADVMKHLTKAELRDLVEYLSGLK